MRRIEADLGGDAIRIHDRVVNAGFYPTPYILCHHISVGYPVLDEGARYLRPLREIVWASHPGADYRGQDVGYRTMAAPRDRFHKEVWEHEMAAGPAGIVPVALANNALGLGFQVESRLDLLPCADQWQNLQAGAYALWGSSRPRITSSATATRGSTAHSSRSSMGRSAATT